MRHLNRRTAMLSAVAGLLTTAALLPAHPAVAADPVRLSGYDVVAAPGSVPRFYPIVNSGTLAWDKLVIAVGTQPMTDPAGAGAGFPKGYVPNPYHCAQPAGYTGVFVCDGPVNQQPDVKVPRDATDTILHWGFARLPRGGDLAEAVKEARSAGSLPADAGRGTGKVTVKSRAHALLNTVGFDLPAVPEGGKVRQQLRVHANDAGRLTLRITDIEGQLTANTPPLRIGGVTTTPGAVCEVRLATLPDYLPNLACELKEGDHVIGYELTSTPGRYAQKLQAYTRYDIYDLGYWDESDVKHVSAPFTAQGRTVRPFHGLHARDAAGKLWEYDSSRKAAAPLDPRVAMGTGWGTYSTVTSLSPYTQGPFTWDGVGPTAATRGLGDVVGRDKSGVLWYYDRRTGVRGGTYAARVRVGAGWNAYDRIVGAGDLNGDKLVDLVARDKAGVLWFYAGTGSQTTANRFKAPVRIGGGWQTFDRLAGGADLTGDGRADLLARDKAGVLWTYPGTGRATAPFGKPVRVGAGWGAYDQLVVTGDVTDDGKADLVARDRSGVLWLYQGTSSSRQRIGGGWNTYDLLF
ncbi:VCBS repeat-containing protein [Streptomyces sp. NPDC091278]|uniref:FG-GAP repeat domain-containing protein n=1 Tax=Streptomyces sp. NPDC091278 TaxID=3155301 RepID=UPI00344F8F0F